MHVSVLPGLRYVTGQLHVDDVPRLHLFYALLVMKTYQNTEQPLYVPLLKLVEHFEAARDRRATYGTGLVNNKLSTAGTYTAMPARHEREQVG